MKWAQFRLRSLIVLMLLAGPVGAWSGPRIVEAVDRWMNPEPAPLITIGLGQDGLPTADLDLTFNQDSFGSDIPFRSGFDPSWFQPDPAE